VPLQEIARAIPDTVATVADLVDERADTLSLDARLQNAAELAGRLTRPQTLKGLTQLVDLAEEAPGFVATAGDILDAWAGHVEDLDERIQRGAHLLSRMSRPETLNNLAQLVEALDGATETARQDSPTFKRMGLFGLLSAMREPEMQTAMAFAVSLARGFSRNLNLPKNGGQLPAGRRQDNG
jgi:hypothetical protein